MTEEEYKQECIRIQQQHKKIMNKHGSKMNPEIIGELTLQMKNNSNILHNYIQEVLQNQIEYESEYAHEQVNKISLNLTRIRSEIAK